VPGGRRPNAGVVAVVVTAVAALAVGVYVLTGSSSPASQPVAAASSSSGISSSLIPDKDEQIARNLTLSTFDFPSQWTSSTHKETAGGRAAGQRLAACAATDTGAVSAPPLVHQRSLDFTNGLFVASSVVDIEATVDTVAHDFAAISDSIFLACMHDLVVDELGGPEVCACLGLQVDAVPVTPPPNAPALTYAFAVRITQRGVILRQINGYLMGEGRTELTIMFVGTEAPFPVGFGYDLLQKTVQRLADNPTN
jgi:hypothetical protein